MIHSLSSTSLAPEGRISQKNKRNVVALSILAFAVVLIFFISLFVGTSNMSFIDSWNGLFGSGSQIQNSIMQNIRLPRVLAGLIAGAGLGVAGLVMQSTLKNPMASPSTLGVSNAAVLGANVALIVLNGGYISSSSQSASVSSSPYAVTLFAFLFALSSILLILLLSSFRGFSPNTVVLSGIALGSLFSAITTIIQYFATDTELSSAVYWTFGDLSRASFTDDWIMLIVVGISIVVFLFLAPKLNAIMSGDDTAKSLGVHISILRFICLLLASLITAACIAFLGIISFVGIVAPHVIKRTLGYNHRFSIIGSALTGSLFLLISDLVARVILQGTSLPVGAITALIGAPFFLYIVFLKRGQEC